MDCEILQQDLVTTQASECDAQTITLEGGANVRLEVIHVIGKVQEYILRKREDDTQSLIQLAGTQFNRKYFSFSFGLKNGLRFHFYSDICLDNQFFNFFLG